MNFISLLSAVTQSGDLWIKLINWINSAIGNYGWTILLLTILVKLVISPLDFAVKLSTKKQSLVQQKCAPEIAKIKKKFGQDNQAVQVHTQALYKREGLRMGVGCIIMLVNLVLTMVIFFSFYSSLRKVSAYEAINQYETLQATFNETTYSELIRLNDQIEGFEVVDTESAQELIEKYNSAYDNVSAHSTDESLEGLSDDELQQLEEDKALVEQIDDLLSVISENVSNAVYEKWLEIKSSWLWVDNIWVADSTTSPFLTYSSLVSTASNGGYSTYVSENISEDEYNAIANIINSKSSRQYNGFYILAILAGVVTFLSQFIAELHTKLKNKKAKIVSEATGGPNMAGSMKLMKFIMPVIMIFFVLSTSASFGIYILASNVASIAFGEISTLIISKLTKNKQLEVEAFLEKEANRMIKKGQLKG